MDVFGSVSGPSQFIFILLIYVNEYSSIFTKYFMHAEPCYSREADT